MRQYNHMEGNRYKMKPIVEFKNVCFDYEGNDSSIPVLEDFNLTVNRGDFLCILGHNGSGKSTVARLINALRVPNSGEVTVDGLSTSVEKNEQEIRRRVGLVFQNPDNQLIATVVEDDVAFGPENLGIEPAKIRQRVDSALKAVGMYDYRKRAPHLLSGGQKQRIAIAGILAMEPECIVLDEPTAMLDPSGRREVLSTLKMLNREKKITVILITHYMDEVVEADRVIVMDNGKILLDDIPKKVFQEVEILKKAGLDVPQSSQFAHELGKIGLSIGYDILTVEDCAKALAEKLSEVK